MVALYIIATICKSFIQEQYILVTSHEHQQSSQGPLDTKILARPQDLCRSKLSYNLCNENWSLRHPLGKQIHFLVQ